MNRKGKKPDRLLVSDQEYGTAPASQDLLKNNSLTRFDSKEPGELQRRHSHRRKNRRFNDKRNG
jgi:hypothetical protein